MRARKDLKSWLDKVGLPYYSPHKFRHGHAVYTLKQAKTISDLKAISLNLMHSDIKITDGVYAILSGIDVKNRITKLNGRNEVSELESLVMRLLDEIKK